MSVEKGVSEKIDILDFPRTELAVELRDTLALEPFRSRQLVQWIYRRRVRDFSEMTDIAQPVRERLAERFYVSRPEIVAVQQSKDGTRKYLFRLQDGSEVESVYIAQTNRYTLCVSSQVGCAMGCKFCRTATMGLKRNLRIGEIVGQVLAVQDDVAMLQQKWASGELDEAVTGHRKPEPFENIVFMGMGEPLHNLDGVIGSVRLLNDNLGCNFSGRKITVSTSGLVPAIETFGSSLAVANLAISLNATTDEVREEIMPVNRKWPLEVLLDVLRRYPLRARKRVTLEYVMLAGVNDTDDDLRRLPRLIHGIPAKVNLIPYNDNSGLGYRSSSRNVIMRWQTELLNRGVCATVRWSKGDDISAACGQLATQSGRPKKASARASLALAPAEELAIDSSVVN